MYGRRLIPLNGRGGGLASQPELRQPYIVFTLTILPLAGTTTAQRSPHDSASTPMRLSLIRP
jgi:hypothetical protein